MTSNMHDFHRGNPITQPPAGGIADHGWLAAAQVRNAREYVELDALENAFWLDAAATGGAS